VDGLNFSKIRPSNKNQAVKLEIKPEMKSQRFSIFLVVCLLMFYGSIFGQKNTQKTSLIPINIGISQYYRPYQKELFVITSTSELLSSHPNYRRISFLVVNPAIRPVPGDFYVRYLGFICKNEWKLDKISPIPFRFRLGSVDYVNYLEGK
jgi:hypothetical protein